MTQNGPKVLEYNCRFGDPETQAILMRLETDLADIVEAVCADRLADVTLTWSPNSAVCVIMAAANYPEDPRKGDIIYGIDLVNNDNTRVFHAGTKFNQDKQLVTAGGRVLGVTAAADCLPLAIAQAYEGVRKIHWDGAYYRTDIGEKALKRN